MPYGIRRGDGPRPWKIVRVDTGKQVGSSKTQSEAKASIRARMANEKKSP